MEALIRECGLNLDDIPTRARAGTNIEIRRPCLKVSKPGGTGNNAEITDQPTPISLPSVQREPEAGGCESPGEGMITEEMQTEAYPVTTAPVDPYLSATFHDPIHSPTTDHGVPDPQHSDLYDPGPNLNMDSTPGQLRYYGSTTQLYVQSCHTQDVDMPVNLDSTTGFVVDMESTQLRKSLIDSGWGHFSRFLSVVDEQLFKAHQAIGKRSQYYSRFLEAALLGCATRISTSRTIRSLGRAYVNQAKQDMVLELEQPTIATLQGLLLLSEFEATSARDRSGWIYSGITSPLRAYKISRLANLISISGIACRLLFDLGLHEDCSQLVESGILTQADADLRHQLFLVAFIYDKQWALYLGRPGCVPLVSLEQRVSHDGPANSLSSLNHWVTLCKFVSEATNLLNGFGAFLDSESIDKLWELSSRISAAQVLLPPELSPKHIPEVSITAYSLNIQFYAIQIVLHRAIVKMLSQNSEGANHDHTAEVKKSRQALYDNASHICHLILTYREMYGVEKIITIMLDSMYMAASTLIAHILQPPARHREHGHGMSDPNALQMLNMIAETTSALQKHYPVTEKMRQTLSRITENTVLAGSFGSFDATSTTSQSQCKELCQDSILAMGWGSMDAFVCDDFMFSQSELLDNSSYVNNSDMQP
ncbi:hypothetical protein LCI18_000123 [Fusarium solani-melongenae]|uniref:Uncharacterized protein n=1 Tax=Fusarium solani subsp. cucurbitae TaxID=2747967 RepID=A0ACD3YK36_FUSSC|nr:hypothetical protein LCI18_000123 [Fusarium solani-melongenae]